MHTVCITAGCEHPQKRHSEYCLACLRSMRDIDLVIAKEPDPATRCFEYDAHCSFCTRGYFLPLTRSQAKLLRQVGMRCGNCGNVVSIEELPARVRSA